MQQSLLQAISLVLLLGPAVGYAESICNDAGSTTGSGTLTDSGGSSGNYSNNENCQFLIQPSSAGDITISFSSFNYENSFDFLRVYDGTTTSGTLLGSFTGTSVPADLTASSGAMLIVSSTDFSITRSGFSASWSTTTSGDNRICAASSASTDTGTLSDPGGAAGNYGNNETCGFLIQPASGAPVLLSFSSFNYENSFDFLRVYDGTSTAGALLGSFTGSSIPANLTAVSGSMFIVHDTDFSVVSSGFVASWNAANAAACNSESVADTFNSVSYSGNTGTESWTTDWLEIGETDGATTGIARVNSSLCTAGNCLRLGEPSGPSTWSNRGVQREVDLAGATSATLFFNYYTGRNRGTQSVALAISDDGGNSWTTLRTYSITNTNFTANPESFDISAYVSEDTRIRFLSSGSSATIGMYIDDLSISYQPNCTSQPIAEWRFDEPNWSGAAGEVGDSQGTFNGQADGGASTIQSGQVCRAASFDGLDDQVLVSNLSSTLSETASLTYWLRSTQTGNNTPSLAPGLAGAEEANGGEDIYWGYIDASGHIGIAAGDVAGAVSTTAVNDGTWHHIALTRNHLSGQVQVFIDGALEAAATSQSGSIGPSFSALGAIRNTQGSNVFLSAAVDEVLMFDAVLAATEIADIYTNQSAANSWDGETRSCPVITASALLIDHDQNGIYCLAEPVSVTAIDPSNSVAATFGSEITLDTQSGQGSWSLATGSGTLIDATADDGVATYQFAVADGGQASFLLSYSNGASPINIDAYQTDSVSVRDDDSEGTLSFAPSGFTVTATSLPNPAPSSINDPIGNQIAATNFSVHVAAFGTTDTDPDCGVIETYQGSTTLEHWIDHVDPTTGTRTTNINGDASGNSEANASSSNLSFVGGQTQFTARYKDAGRIRIHLKDSASYSHTLQGSTNSFVVSPHRLAITSVESNTGLSNPAAVNMEGAGFVPSGENFRVVAEAQDADGDITPNFGLENSPELISVFSDSLIAPVGGRHGSTNGISGGSSLTRTGSGSFSSTTVHFDEVGIIRLGAQLRDGNYLGAGAVTGALTSNVGRFYPAAIELTTGGATTTCNSFAYQDQPALQLNYRLLARNALGATVENYDEDLLGVSNVAEIVRSAENANTGVSLEARLSSGTATWQNGELNEFDTSAIFARAASPDGPFDDLQLGIKLNDLRDGLTISGANQNDSTTGDCVLAGNCDAISLGAPIVVRYGRLVVLPRSSSEMTDLDVPLIAQYFDGVDFREHQADNCTNYAQAEATLSAYQEDLAAGETSLIGPSVASALVNGAPDPMAPLLLSAPGAGNRGSVLLQLDTPEWLEYDWFGTGDADPSGRQTFGLFRGHDRVVFWSELQE